MVRWRGGAVVRDYSVARWRGAAVVRDYSGGAISALRVFSSPPELGGVRGGLNNRQVRGLNNRQIRGLNNRQLRV